MHQLPAFSLPHEEAQGLLWAYAGSATGPAVRLSAAEIPAALATQAWVWIHLDLVDQRACGWAQGVVGLSDALASGLAARDGGFRFSAGEDGVHGACADLAIDSTRLSDSVGQFGFVARDRLIVTGQRHPLAGIDAVRKAARDGTRFATGYAVLGAIVGGFCRVALARVRDAEADLDRVEDGILATHAPDERAALKAVRRLALALHRPVAEMVELLRDAEAEAEGRDEDEAAPAMAPAALALANELAGRLDALDQAVRSLGERAKLLQEELAAELADESNRSLRALTVMTALLLPGSLVAGIFGMNTGGLPFAHSLGGTIAAVAVGGVATYVFYRILVRAGASLRF